MLLHSCNPPYGQCCQSPITTDTGLDGLLFTYSGWVYVPPAAFLQKASRSHAKICLYSVALYYRMAE